MHATLLVGRPCQIFTSKMLQFATYCEPRSRVQDQCSNITCTKHHKRSIISLINLPFQVSPSNQLIGIAATTLLAQPVHFEVINWVVASLLTSQVETLSQIEADLGLN